MPRARKPIAAFAVTALAVVGLAACNGGGAGSKPAAPKAGAPIRLLVDTPLTGGAATGGVAFPGPVAGAKAAAYDLNKTGGINGHQVVIDACDNKADPNGGSVCARNAKANGDIAVVGSFDVTGAANTVPILQKEGIAYVGGLPASQVELTNTDSFQFDGGLALGGFSLVAEAQSLGCKKVVDFSPGGPEAALDPVIKGVFEKTGIGYDIVQAPPTTPDDTAFVSQALADKPDCITAAGPGAEDVKLIATVRKSNTTVKIISAVGSLLPQLLPSLGSAATGIYAVNTTLLPSSTDPLVTQFRNDIIGSMGQAAGMANLNEFAQDGWSSVMLVKQALSGATTVSAASVLNGLNHLTAATPGNAHDPVDFTKPISSKLFPRLFNPYVRFFTVKNGQYVDLDNQWHAVAQFIP